MSYEPPRHVLLRRQTDAITDRDVAFFEHALSAQIRECALAYELPPPGVTFLAPDAHLPACEAVAIDLVDNDGAIGSAAHHGWNPGAAFAWALVGVKEAWSWQLAASHEALEYLVNMKLDQWVTDPTGARWAKEICDPVEEDAYEVEVELFDEKRTVTLSDYVLPAWWNLAAPGPYDRLGRVQSPLTLARGGYALVERGGAIQDLGASRSARHGSQAAPRLTSRAAWIRAGRR